MKNYKISGLKTYISSTTGKEKTKSEYLGKWETKEDAMSMIASMEREYKNPPFPAYHPFNGYKLTNIETGEVETRFFE